MSTWSRRARPASSRPGRAVVRAQWAQGYLPLWDPAQDGGRLLLANPNHRVLHPSALFDLVVPGTTDPDYRAMHAGTPVWSGEKWACNFWFCERAVKGASQKGRASSRPRGSKKRKRRR